MKLGPFLGPFFVLFIKTPKRTETHFKPLLRAFYISMICCVKSLTK